MSSSIWLISKEDEINELLERRATTPQYDVTKGEPPVRAQSLTATKASKNMVETSVLKREMANFIATMQDVFNESETAQAAVTTTEYVAGGSGSSVDARSGLRLEEIELSVQISAEGQVGFLCFGSAKLGTSGAVKLHFKRRPSPPLVS